MRGLGVITSGLWGARHLRGSGVIERLFASTAGVSTRPLHAIEAFQGQVVNQGERYC